MRQFPAARKIVAFVTGMFIAGICSQTWSEPLLPVDTINYVARLPLSRSGNNGGDSANPSAGLTGPVYRVQVLTSASFASARLTSRVAQELFDDTVSVDFESPNFKVRIGMCGSPVEAQKLRERIIQAGFSNPLVVSQTMTQHADSSFTPLTSETANPK